MNTHYIAIYEIENHIHPDCDTIEKAMKIAAAKASDRHIKRDVILYQSLCSVMNKSESKDIRIEIEKHKTPSLLEFDPLNCIDFNVKDKVDIKSALDEALEFLQTHHIDQVNVYVNDYLFMIDDEDADTEEMYKEYQDYLSS